MSYFLCPSLSLLSRPCAERLFAAIHSTAYISQRAPQNQTAASPQRTSRTRLTKDLRPSSGSGVYQVAKIKRVRSRESTFERDSVPHVGHATKEEAYRRSRGREVHQRQQPLESHRFTWDVELEYRRDVTGSQRQSRISPSSTPGRSHRKERDILPSSSNYASKLQKDLPTQFTSPPIMPGLLSCLKDLIGPDARPTPIQSLSLKWLLERPSQRDEASTGQGWKHFLLASETGSGKSIAYLLPVLQALKQSELQSNGPQSHSSGEDSSKLPLNPRALVLAPTHELSRQLSTFAKSLIHEVKLRILSASRANIRNSRPSDSTASKMMAGLEVGRTDTGSTSSELQIQAGKSGWPVDMVVGTPNKLLDMVRGRGWDWEEGIESDNLDDKLSRRGRERTRGQPEMGLANVEWVIVDEADVLMDPDFQETTLALLADISAARGRPIHQSGRDTNGNASTIPKEPIEYPFNLIFTSATIPSALATHLDTYHPKLVRLISPGVHHLPKTLQTEFVSWTGGNKNADIEHRIRRVWAQDASQGGIGSKRPSRDGNGQSQPALSKILIFCNQNTKVEALSTYLSEKGIKNVALTSQGSERKKGSNHHLDGFLRVPGSKAASASNTTTTSSSDPSQAPHVMITTSLLSRGLDFSPDIRHVFIVDEPRNMIDFLHRAGRSGRAGERGRVVVFGKMKGRGSAKAKDVRKKVKALT